MTYQIKDKKKALLAYKEEILRDLKYFEKRIEDAHAQKTNASYFDDDDDDSDSDNFYTIDMGPSIRDLKLEQERLQTCLHATQELTNLCVLQSEVNVMVNDPEYGREALVTEQGTWREVTADCRVDLVPFSITYYTHQASRLFGPISYRGLRVSPVKAAHENELSKSILPRVTTPSDAVEVLRSYAVAHRSRRTTLARLAEKYSNSLFMEPMAEGGYIMKCVNLLEVSWTLENKWSPIAPFHHRMKFDLEYMDEAYVKIISQAHRELSDPTLETDERTRLLSKIIATCLEAQGPTQELYESMESDIESENLRKRRTTLDEEIEEPVNKKKKDSEIMAPPKTLPKKTKPKGKENNADNNRNSKVVKRSTTDDREGGSKKARLNQDNLVKSNTMNPKSKVDKAALNRDTNNKKSNVEDNNARKTNVDKKITHDKEKSVAKKSDKDKVQQNSEASELHTDKKALVTSKKGSGSKADNVNKKASSSKLDSVKHTDNNTKNSTDNLRNVGDNVSNKNIVDNQNQKGKSATEKNIADTENTMYPANVKQSNKVPDNVPNQDTAKRSSKVDKIKKANSNNIPKNVEDTNRGISKVALSGDQNVESSSQNNENPRTSKASSNKKNTASKNDNLNTLTKVSATEPISNAKSKGNVNENVANLDNNINKKSVIKTKSSERPKIANPVVDSENLNAVNKNTLINNKTNKGSNSDKINVKTVSVDRTMKSNSKESLNDNAIKTKSSKSSKQNNIIKHVVPKNSSKQASEKENNKQFTTENVAKPKLNKKNINSHPNIEKVLHKRDFPHSEVNQDDTQLKTVVKNMNGKSKNKDIVIDKIDENNMTERNNIADLKKDHNKNVSNLNNKMPTVKKILNERNSVQLPENTGHSLLKQKTIEQKILAKDHDKNRQFKTKLNIKSNTHNIIKNTNNDKNLKPSKSPIQNKMKILNPRSKSSLDKLKVKRQQESLNGVQNKILTKIPQKLMSVREHIVKKNPLRISPRKLNSSMKTDSLNLSRSSLRSLRKPVTGIPRLMKKPIRKT